MVSEPSYLKQLNEAQRQAVCSSSRRLLVLAGAGSGKTRVLTSRIAYLIEELGLAARGILAVTFTNKAAKEMRARALRLSAAAEEARLSTFHSFGARFLRDYARLLKLPYYFSIYDDSESLALLKRLYPSEPQNQLKKWQRAISRIKDQALEGQDDWGPWEADSELRAVYQAYEAALAQSGALDFGDLIVKPLRALQQDAALQKQVQKRYQAILVDEYQDTNIAQAKLLRALAGPQTYITVVGDEDQSIYGFRGAEPANILLFPQEFPGSEMVKLEENYRSTQPILACANTVIAYNKGRFGKTLFTRRQQGELPQLSVVEDSEAEARFCLQLLQDGRYEETAILYRTNAQSRIFETLFTQNNIPFRLVGTVRFFAREEVKTALALLTLLVNPNDEAAFLRVVNKPSRGLGKKALELVAQKRGAGQEASQLAALQQALPELKGKAAVGAADFLTVCHLLQQTLPNAHLPAFLAFALDKSRLADYYKEQDVAEGSDRLGNLRELAGALEPYGSGAEGLAAFLESAALNAGEEARQDDNMPRVTLITMHNTKGLEFDRVIVTGMEENLFPRADPYDINYEEELEEERRLCYVAITRARYELYFTCCRWRQLYGKSYKAKPSRFLFELPEDACLGLQALSGASSALPQGFAVGAWVRHMEFGLGKIVRREIKGGHELLDIAFEGGAKKRFFAQFTYLEKVKPPSEFD